MSGGGDGLDFFPLDLESGPEFLAVYAVIGLLGVLGAKLAQSITLDIADRTAPDTGPPSARSHLRLSIGHFPRPEEVPLVAYLRKGTDGVAEVLVAKAVAEGLLVPAGDRRMSVIAGSGGYSDDTHALSLKLPRGSVSIREAMQHAGRIAETRAAAMSRELLAAGLHRPATRLAAGVAVFGLAAGGVLLLGLLRLARGLSLGRPVAFLGLELAALFVICLVAARPERRTVTGDRYLKWLHDSTRSLREDVRTNVAARRDDVALAAAVAGVALIPAFLWAEQDGHGNVAAHSSCGGPSCGGGGGCGGGGCGGGGCGG